MGMDVYGNSPKNKHGEYFRANVWWWHPLWDYCTKKHPNITKSVKYGHTNDGDGLNEEDSLKLAKALTKDIEDGTVREYVRIYNKHIKSIPLDTCIICGGTGKRKEWPKDCTKEHIKACNGCNGCNGTGKTENILAYYHIDVSIVRDFAKFLESCGGFQIC